ncbi:MAG: replicative DNA helicase [Candidatus Hydrogenedentota bacterium]
MAQSNSTANDRMPPQNIDAERSVLGAMLLNPDAVGPVTEILQGNAVEVFYAPAHQYIYDAIVNLYAKTQPIDAITLKDQMERSGTLDDAGGLAYITDLTGAVPTSANVQHYARIVLDASILRRVIGSCSNVIAEAYDSPEDVNKLLDAAESEIFKIAEQRQLNPIAKVSELLQESMRRIEEQMKSKSGITGIATGFMKLDEMTSGFQPSDMVVLAARPSVGKTAFALNIASHAAVQNKQNVLIFSLEMAKEQLVQRLLCMVGNVDSQRLRTGFLAGQEYPKLQKAADTLSHASIFIDDTANISILELRSKARKHASTYGSCDLLIIDYLQLMVGGGRAESRQVEIAEISRSIKGLARELKCPVLALSQLSREADKDGGGAPKLSHLRESGAIEQDADVVLMLSRPAAHDTESMPDLIHLSIAKQRNGPTGDANMLFDKNLQRFKNLMEGGGSFHAEPPPEASQTYDNVPVEEEYEEDDVPF